MALLLFSWSSFAIIPQSINKNASAYQMGIAALINGKNKNAIAYFKQAINANKLYSDNARLELVQLMAIDKKNDLDAIRKILNSFNNDDLKPEALMATSYALLSNKRHLESLELAQEIVTNFPESNLADDALLLSAEIFYYKLKNEIIASETIVSCLTRYPKSNKKNRLYYLLAKIYISPNQLNNRERGCYFFLAYLNKDREEQGKYQNKYNEDLNKKALETLCKN